MLMLDLLLEAIAALGCNEAENLLAAAGESALKKYNDTHAWKKLLVDTGAFYANFEKEENSFFKDLALVLSKENLSQIAKDLQSNGGYDLKDKLYDSFMQLMRQYDIPYEISESYTFRIIYAVLEQLKIVNPEKYEHYFLQEWRDEQEKSFQELQSRIDKMSHDLKTYQQEKVDILSSGKIDIELGKHTQNPSIGIKFFIVDDERYVIRVYKSPLYSFLLHIA